MAKLSEIPEFYQCSKCGEYKELKEMCKIKRKFALTDSSKFKLVCKECIKPSDN